MALSLSDIKEYKALALAYPGKRGSEVILRLLDEIQEYHREIVELRLKTADKFGEYDDHTPCPFGKEWKGYKLKDVDWEWLQWWFSKNMRRDEIIIDMDFGPWPKRKMAVRKLRLHDYIKRRLKEQRNGASIQQA